MPQSSSSFVPFLQVVFRWSKAILDAAFAERTATLDLHSRPAIADHDRGSRRGHTCLGMLVLLVCIGGAGCRGYHLGNQYSFRNDIRTVHVGIFESDSYRRFLGQQLTEAVVKEIESQTPYTITEPAVADSFVQGRILRDSKRVIGENRLDEPRSLEYGWQIEVTWVDRAGVPLMNRQLIRVHDDVTFIPEGGQSLSSAQQALVIRMARQIVGQMEAPW